MNLAGWAVSQGVARPTAYRWSRNGVLPVHARKVGGLILVDVPVGGADGRKTSVVYARVSSSDQKKADLDGRSRG